MQSQRACAIVLTKLTGVQEMNQAERLKSYIKGVPKAELHLHIEGTLEPELAFRIGERNGVRLEGTVESHRKRRQSFKVRSS